MATGFALVGTGMISHFHAKAIAAMRGAKLVACFNHTPESAREFAKEHGVQLSWSYAQDTPLHPGDQDLKGEALDKKRVSWLRRHDQDTCNLPSLLPLAVGLPVRLTDNVDRDLHLYRGR